MLSHAREDGLKVLARQPWVILYQLGLRPAFRKTIYREL